MSDDTEIARLEKILDRPTKYGWTMKSMNFGRDLGGAFLFFVDDNGNQHKLDFNENQVLLILRQLPDVIISASVVKDV